VAAVTLTLKVHDGTPTVMFPPRVNDVAPLVGAPVNAEQVEAKFGVGATVRPAGRVSVTVIGLATVPRETEGPRLRTCRFQLNCCPGTATAFNSCDLTMARSATVSSGTVSVAVLSPARSGVFVAVIATPLVRVCSVASLGS